MEKIGELGQAELASGMWPSVHRKQVPLWKEGENVDFVSTGPKKAQGFTAPTTPTTDGLPLRGMGQNTRNDGSTHIYTGDSGKLYHWNGTTLATEGTGYTGIEDATSSQIATTWSFKEYGDWVIATNGVDTIQINKASSFSALGGVSTFFDTAEVVEAMNEHICVYNTDNSPYEIRWSAIGNPEQWDPATYPTSGAYVLREARSPIVAAVPLQEAIAIYTKEGLFLQEYVGNNNFRFRFRHAINGIGAVSKCAVVSLGRFNYGLGSGGFWKTDGGSFEYIDEPAIRDYWRDNLATDQASKVCAYHNEDEKQIIWFFPSSDEPNKGVAFDYVQGQWSILGYGRTAAVERNAFDDPYTADSSGTLYRQNQGNDAGGSPLIAWARTKGMDLGDANVSKVLLGIRVGYIGSGLYMRIGTKEAPEQSTVDWGPYRPVTSDRLETVRRGGKLIYLEFKSEDLSVAWSLMSVELYGTVGGSRP